jgi:hypothetical protein
VNDDTQFSDEIRIFSIIALRAGLGSTVQADIQELIHLHMATCTSISDERDQIVCAYPTEPILAAAAQVIMNHEGMWEQVLKCIKHRLFRGILTTTSGVGEVGELLGSLLFLRAFDKAALHKRQDQQDVEAAQPPITVLAPIEAPKEQAKVANKIINYMIPIPFIDVLAEWYSEDQFQIIIDHMKSTCPDLLLGFVFFNHVIKLNEVVELTVDHLYNYFERGAAILLQNGAGGKNCCLLYSYIVYFM